MGWVDGARLGRAVGALGEPYPPSQARKNPLNREAIQGCMG